jgi:hypothetical protein
LVPLPEYRKRERGAVNRLRRRLPNEVFCIQAMTSGTRERNKIKFADHREERAGLDVL